MRLCRFEHNGQQHVGVYSDQHVLPLTRLAEAANVAFSDPPSPDAILSPFLPGGSEYESVQRIEQSFLELDREKIAIPHEDVTLLVPVANPSKLMLLAGNYSKHIEEGGGKAEERAKTFPYVFMKPPLTTLTHPGQPVKIPAVSPDHIDWELELGVVIGRTCKNVTEETALDYVAGYTIINDISDRRFRPNPDRAKREKDGFFDWLHGKWHDTFCPMGPCILPATPTLDPQSLKMTLKVNGEIEQDASTAEMVFPVAAIVAFISQLVTLVPGDVISTGTPSGVGFAKGKFLRPCDVMEAEIEHIGVLQNPVE